MERNTLFIDNEWEKFKKLNYEKNNIFVNDNLTISRKNYFRDCINNYVQHCFKNILIKIA